MWEIDVAVKYFPSVVDCFLVFFGCGVILKVIEVKDKAREFRVSGWADILKSSNRSLGGLLSLLGTSLFNCIKAAAINLSFMTM